MQQEQAPAAASRGLLGALCAGDGKQLQGKSFYLDSVKACSVTLLVDAISLLGGKVESFLHKDVSFVVTGDPEEEGLKRSPPCVVSKVGSASKGTTGEDVRRSAQRENAHHTPPPPSGRHAHPQRADTPRPPPCGSRGKALLEKAIRNNGQVTSVLANARSWGVKILFVDDVLSYLQRLSRDSFSTKHSRAPAEQKNSTRCLTARVIKAVSLRSPYIKVEDLSRKFKPLLLQSMTMPTLCYGGRFSPFEPPPPPRPEGKTKEKRKDKDRDGGKAVRSSQNKPPQSPTALDPLPRQSRKKDMGYCECCHVAYANQEQHLQSSEHRSFVLDASNYLEVNQLVADMCPGFSLHPPTRLPTTPPPIQVPSPAELEFLTDVEADQALQALLIQAQAPRSPQTKPLSSGPPGVPLPNADSQPPHDPSPTQPDPAGVGLACPPRSPDNTDANSQPPSHPSPGTPRLDSQSDGPCSSADLRSEPPLLTPYSDSPDLVPPVLSPQVPDDLLEPHSPYSQPPVLSPPHVQPRPHSPYYYLPYEDFAVMEICPLTQTTEVVCHFVPLCHGSNGEGQPPLWSDGLTRDDERPPGHAVRRSRSLPRLSATIPNGGKRCCSASPERSPRKRRRVSLASSRGLRPMFYPVNVTYNDRPEDSVTPVVEADVLMDLPANHTTSVCSAAYSTVEHLYFNTDHRQNLNLAAASLVPPDLTDFPQWLGHISGLRSTSVKPPPTRDTETPLPTNRVVPGTLTTTARTPDDRVLYSRCSVASSSEEESHLSISSSSSVSAPEMAHHALSPSSSSDSDWDCELLARLDQLGNARNKTASLLRPAPHAAGGGGRVVLDQELLHRPCHRSSGLNSTGYESRLHSALQSPPPTPPPATALVVVLRGGNGPNVRVLHKNRPVHVLHENRPVRVLHKNRPVRVLHKNRPVRVLQKN